MSTPNINDVESVKALLDQLRGSQAWQDIAKPLSTDTGVTQAQNASSAQEELGQGTDAGAFISSSTPPQVQEEKAAPSVASLLAQLQSQPTPTPSSSSSLLTSSASYPAHQPSGHSTRHQSSVKHPPNSVPPSQPGAGGIPQNAIAPPAPSPDVRSYTFQQTLPIISQLAENPAFLSAVNQMKKEQDELERQLWQDRRNIYRKYEEKVKVAQTKATLIGDSGVSKHEAEMIQAGLKKELERFDRERVLVAWDGLIAKHQTALANLGVPTMFATDSTSDREKQQKVMQVLEGFL